MKDKTIIILYDHDWCPEDICEYGTVVVNTEDLPKISPMLDAIRETNDKIIAKVQKYNANRLKAGTVGAVCPEMVPKMEYVKPIDIFIRTLTEQGIEVQKIDSVHYSIGG